MDSTDELQCTLAEAVRGRTPVPTPNHDGNDPWQGRAKALCHACPRLVLADGTCYRELRGKCPT